MTELIHRIPLRNLQNQPQRGLGRSDPMSSPVGRSKSCAPQLSRPYSKAAQAQPLVLRGEGNPSPRSAGAAGPRWASLCFRTALGGPKSRWRFAQPARPRISHFLCNTIKRERDSRRLLSLGRSPALPFCTRAIREDRPCPPPAPRCSAAILYDCACPGARMARCSRKFRSSATHL